MAWLLAVLTPLVFSAYALTTDFIPSASMLPTLRPGDHILTMRAWLAYPSGRTPSRGDIITFVAPKAIQSSDGSGGRRLKLGFFRREAGDILIKRVVGLPGETVQIVGTDILIDGRKTAVPRPAATAPGALAVGDYAVGRPLKLGPDELFVLGDNSDNSDDGRFWGPLKRGNVIGRFVCVLFHERANGPNMKKIHAEGNT